MAFKIVNKQILSDQIKRLDIMAPEIAQKAQPGQFVMIRPSVNTQMVPLTIVEVDKSRRIIALIIQEKEKAVHQLASLQIHDQVDSLFGPLGRPASVDHLGTVICVGTGPGIAHILPIARAFKQAGNKVLGIVGAETKSELMLEPQMRIACEKVIITTSDGSYQSKGTVTNALKEFLDHQSVNLVYAIGSIETMKAVCAMTKTRSIKTLVQLNPVMLDGTGQCASCRVKVDGRTQLACIDGPEFDGQMVDYDYLSVRTEASKYVQETTKSSSTLTSKRNGFIKNFLVDIKNNND